MTLVWIGIIIVLLILSQVLEFTTMNSIVRNMNNDINKHYAKVLITIIIVGGCGIVLLLMLISAFKS